MATALVTTYIVGTQHCYKFIEEARLKVATVDQHCFHGIARSWIVTLCIQDLGVHWMETKYKYTVSEAFQQAKQEWENKMTAFLVDDESISKQHLRRLEHARKGST